MSKQCDIVRDILPLYVDDACSEASAEMVKEHLNACADCNAIYQKLLSHTSEDVLHEESESVIMRHEAKRKAERQKKDNDCCSRFHRSLYHCNFYSSLSVTYKHCL